MEGDNAPYKISVTQSRVSSPLWPNPYQIKLNLAKILNASQTIVTYLPLSSASFRVFKGPQPYIKLLLMHRTFSYYPPGQMQYFLYMRLLIVDMNSDVLQYYVLMQKLQNKQNKVRDVSMHPNGKQLIVFYENKIQKYLLQIPKPQKQISKYLLTKVKEKIIPSMQIYDLQYHPSGQYLVGLHRLTQNINNVKKYQIRPFKLSPIDFEINFGLNAEGQCLDSSLIGYLSKRIISIDPNQQSKVAFGYRTNKICIWDTKKINAPFEYRFINTTTPAIANFSPTQPFQHQVTTITGTGFLNSTKDGYFIAYDSNNLLGTIFTSNGSNFYDSFNYILPNQSKSDKFIVKCIEIYEINSFACSNYNQNHVYISKVDMQKRLTYTLNIILNQQNSKKQYRVEDIFYYPKNSQICRIYKQTLECFLITTKFQPNQQASPLNLTSKACQTTKFWNPVSMQCQQCPNNSCTCNNKIKTFNPYYRECKIDCSKIDGAIDGTEFSNYNKCTCQRMYQWSNLHNICRVNCDKIKYADNKTDLSKLPINQCKCVPNFTYKVKLGSSQQPGFCELMCQNHKPPMYENNQPYCICQTNQFWDKSTHRCLNISQAKKGIPGWAIALIILSVLLLIGLIAFMIYRKKFKKRNQSDEEFQEAQSPVSKRNQDVNTQRNLTKNNQDAQDAKTQQSDVKLAGKKFCPICQKNDEQVNCQGPCGHAYHFMCISNRIDQGQVDCPQCFKVFHNGISDLKMLQKQQDFITITEN